jgi:hypothetical protein
MENLMQITWKDLIVDQIGINIDEILEDWRWLIPEHHTLLLVSALGDLFLLANNQSVFWLDTGSALLTKVSDSIDEFNDLVHNVDNVNEWFCPELIAGLKAQGITLGNQQCYSYKRPLTLDGTMDPANFEPADISVHFSVLGQLQKQVRDLPSGTKVKSVQINQGRV